MSSTEKHYALQLIDLTSDYVKYDAGNVWRSKDGESLSFDVFYILVLCGAETGVRPVAKDSNFIITTAESLLPTRLTSDVFAAVDAIEYELLIAVKDLAQRMSIYRDPLWLAEGKSIGVGSRVVVLPTKDSKEPGMSGVVRFAGEISGGRYFGVELDAAFVGKGHSDGTFKRKRYFPCDEDGAVFFTLWRIRVKKTDGGAVTRLGRKDSEASLKEKTSSGQLIVGERIVWMSDGGPEFGTVRWIGLLPDAARTDGPTVGVEFDRPIGSGTGRYKSQRLFEAPRGHASLVPILGLMRMADFGGVDLPGFRNVRDAAVVPPPRPTPENVKNNAPFDSNSGYDFPEMVGFVPPPLSLPQTDGGGGGQEDEVATVTGHFETMKMRQSATMKGLVQPPSVAADAVDVLCGLNRGIQVGSDATCAVESVVYALFAFSSALDSRLYSEEPASETLAGAVKTLLVEQIVNPLRAAAYVSASKVARFGELVSMMNAAGVRPEDEAIERCLRCVLRDLLKLDPTVCFSSGRADYVFTVAVMDAVIPVENLQHALVRTCLQSRRRLARPPSPVFVVSTNTPDRSSAATAALGTIFPTRFVDVYDIIDGFPGACRICGGAGDSACGDCFLSEFKSTRVDSGRMADVTYCRTCFETYHQHLYRRRHERIVIPTDVVASVVGSPSERVQMELFAMISRIKGRYVTFVKFGPTRNSTWLCYDGTARKSSAAAASGGAKDSFVPEVRQCREVGRCLAQFGTSPYTSLASLPEIVRDVIGGLRFCFYQPTTAN